MKISVRGGLRTNASQHACARNVVQTLLREQKALWYKEARRLHNMQNFLDEEEEEEDGNPKRRKLTEKEKEARTLEELKTVLAEEASEYRQKEQEKREQDEKRKREKELAKELLETGKMGVHVSEAMAASVMRDAQFNPTTTTAKTGRKKPTRRRHLIGEEKLQERAKPHLQHTPSVPLANLADENYMDVAAKQFEAGQSYEPVQPPPPELGKLTHSAYQPTAPGFIQSTMPQEEEKRASLYPLLDDEDEEEEGRVLQVYDDI